MFRSIIASLALSAAVLAPVAIASPAQAEAALLALMAP